MDDISFQILQIYSQRNNLSLIELGAILDNDPLLLAEPVNYLRNEKYLRIKDDHAMSRELNEESPLFLNTPIEITFKGKAELNLATKSKKHYKYNELRAWITLAIALAAFIKSFFL